MLFLPGFGTNLGAPSRCRKRVSPQPLTGPTILGGSWDLVSEVISTLIGVRSSYKYSYPHYNPSY